MFETQETPGILKLFLRYFLQLVLCGPLIVIVSSLFSLLLSLCGLSGQLPNGVYFGGYDAIVCLFVGIATGWNLGRERPSLVATGRWVWVLPSLVLLPDLIRESVSSQPLLGLPEEFFATGGNEGLGVLLLTLPGASALGYSIGMALIGTRTKWSRLTRRIPLPHAASVALFWTALLAVMFPLAHRFERSQLEGGKKDRRVIDPSGLLMSPDATAFCVKPAEAAGVRLSYGTRIQGFERRMCSHGHLINDDGLAPKSAWRVERVKVLSGLRRGSEGWVMAYGLEEDVSR